MLQDYFYKQAETLINKHDSSSSEKDLAKYLRDEFCNEPIEIQTRIINEFFNYGPIHSLISNDQISEIIINGSANIIYEENGKFIKHNDSFYNDKTYDNFIHKLSIETHSKINLTTPHLNAKWKGFRVHIISSPISNPTCISLRRNSSDHWDFKKLFDNSWAPVEQINFLKEKIYNKKNILIIGPTGSGKTTILNSCLKILPPLDRCIIIEDTDELVCPNFSSTKLLTRNEKNNELNNYQQADLLKQSLRMRPQRIIIGEIRGPEAMDYLMALSTGHEGGLCSLHASCAKQALIRLEMLIQLGAPQWSLNSIRQLIQLSLDYIVTVNIKNGQRYLDGIHCITSLESSGFILDNCYNFKYFNLNT